VSQQSGTTRASIGRAGSAAITLLTLIACAPPASYEGTPYGHGIGVGGSSQDDKEQTPTTTGDRPKTNAPSPTIETPDPAASQTAAARPSASPVPSAAPTTAPTPRTAPSTPNCQNSNPDACFSCCLQANPDAAGLESSYDACLNNTVDDFGVTQCQNTHASQCNASAACRQHHACLSANGCLGPLS
jgi:hypothetical protein